MRAGIAILLIIIGVFFLWEVIAGKSEMLLNSIRNQQEYGGSSGEQAGQLS